MRSRYITAFLIMAFAAVSWVLMAQTPMPRCTSAEPYTAKVGDVVTVNGEHLGKDQVAEIFLTTGQQDFKLAMLEQSDTAIKFKVPTSIKPGKYAILILTKGSDPKLIQQPVRVVIEEAGATATES